MNIQLIILSIFLYKSIATEIGDDNEWLKFKTENSKNYTKTEEKIRRKIWNENVLKIRNINCKQGNFTMKINGKFGDLTEEESAKLLGFMPTKSFRTNNNARSVARTNLQVPSVDWRLNGTVTPAKDQKNCSCCYVFAGIFHFNS
jgi:cathepsin L